MKRRVVMAVIGTTIALQACNVSAIDTKAAEDRGMKAEFGIELNAEDSHIIADYNLEIAADKTKKMSLDADVAIEKEKYNLDLDDILIMDSDNLYINVSKALDAIHEVAEEEDVEDVLGTINTTDGWVVLPMPEFDKMGVEIKKESEGIDRVINPEMKSDLHSVIEVFGPIEEDGVTTFCIDNASILEAAKKADEVIVAHQDEFVEFPEKQTIISLDELDLIAPFERYIAAAGAGMAEATGISEEKATAQLKQLFSLLTKLTVGLNNTSMLLDDEKDTSEAISSLHVYERVQEVLEGSDIRASYTYDDNSAELVIGINGDMFVAHAAIQEDDTVSITIGDGEDIYMSGIAEKQDGVLKGELKDEDGEVVGNIELELLENGVAAIISEDEGESIKFMAEKTDTGMNAEFDADDVMLMFSVEGSSEDAKDTGSFQVKIGSDDLELTLAANANIEIPSEPMSIEIPEAADGLEVIKNISARFFESSKQKESGVESEDGDTETGSL